MNGSRFPLKRLALDLGAIILATLALVEATVLIAIASLL